MPNITEDMRGIKPGIWNTEQLTSPDGGEQIRLTAPDGADSGWCNRLQAAIFKETWEAKQKENKDG